MTATWWIACFVSSVPTLSQIVEGPREELPRNPPQVAALPAAQARLDPDSALALLDSRDSAQIQSALERLGLAPYSSLPPRAVVLSAVNLDQDRDLEGVLQIDMGTSAAAVVFKKREEGWWQIGVFGCCGARAGVARPFCGTTGDGVAWDHRLSGARGRVAGHRGRADDSGDLSDVARPPVSGPGCRGERVELGRVRIDEDHLYRP